MLIASFLKSPAGLSSRFLSKHINLLAVDEADDITHVACNVLLSCSNYLTKTWTCNACLKVQVKMTSYHILYTKIYVYIYILYMLYMFIYALYVSLSLLIRAMERTVQHSCNNAKIGVIFNLYINN